MYKLYILKCADDTLYTGITNDLETRLKKHNGELTGGAKYTRGRRPVELVYTETMRTKSDALKREAQIKKLTKSKKLALIKTPKKHLLYEKIKNYTLKDAIEMEEADRQYGALSELYNNISAENREHKISYVLIFTLVNALLAYQLSGRGEDYWEEFRDYFSQNYDEKLKLEAKTIESVMLDFLSVCQYNKRLINMKKKRLKKVALLAEKLVGKEAYYYKNMQKLLILLANELGQKPDAKTVTFAIKMYGYAARNIFDFVSYPASIFIPIDSRLTKLYEKYRGNYNDIYAFYYDLAELSGIPMMHLDGIVWNEAERLLE